MHMRLLFVTVALGLSATASAWGHVGGGTIPLARAACCAVAARDRLVHDDPPLKLQRAQPEQRAVTGAPGDREPLSLTGNGAGTAGAPLEPKRLWGCGIPFKFACQEMGSGLWPGSLDHPSGLVDV